MGKPINILIAISDLSGGGAERGMSDLLGHMPRELFSPHLCFWRPVFVYPLPEDIPYTIVEKTRPWHTPRTILGMARLIDELRPQIVYSGLHFVNMVTGSALALSRHNPKWVCRQHNDPRREMPWPFVIWARWALRRADLALGVSKGVSQAMVEYLHLDPKRVETVRTVIDVQMIDHLAQDPIPIAKDPNIFTVVHAGRLARQKNQALLLEAFSRLRGRPAELWMLGEGPLLSSLQAQASRLGIEDQVRWLGFQQNPFPFFREADCFALSSDHEGLPNTITESMICGTPPVSTRCLYGPDELIEDGVTGLLTPVGDAEALASGLLRLAEDPALAGRMGKQAREWAVENFGNNQSCHELYGIFQRLIEG